MSILSHLTSSRPRLMVCTSPELVYLGGYPSSSVVSKSCSLSTILNCNTKCVIFSAVQSKRISPTYPQPRVLVEICRSWPTLILEEADMVPAFENCTKVAQLLRLQDLRDFLIPIKAGESCQTLSLNLNFRSRIKRISYSCPTHSPSLFMPLKLSMSCLTNTWLEIVFRRYVIYRVSQS